MTLAAGTTIGSYSIESVLGRGGMGEVYLATDESLGRKVALKLLTPELAADEGFRQRFIAESRTAASMDHPHIVPIYESGEIDGRLFLAMRYVAGADLGAIIAREGPLQLSRAIGLLRGIADALDAAHERGLVHRDVKPSNILVARTSHGDEHAYLADFGLTKHLGPDAGFTRSGELVGSVDYISPEQIQGHPIDHRADVYSLACVLYTALAGRPPFERGSEMATLWAHVEGSVPRLSELRAELAGLDDVLATGMAKDAARRYASAGSLIDSAETHSSTPALRERDDGAPFLEADTTSGPQHHLPRHGGVMSRPRAPTLTDIIGRDDARVAVHDRLRRNRLVTITGLGGMGKTRLALSIADELGAPVVDLTAITDQLLIFSEIAVTLGLHLDPSRPALQGLSDAIAGAYPLIILDNLEQILNAGDAVAPLLAHAPKLQLLVTSRRPIGVLGEAELALEPLSIADSDDIAVIEDSPAGALLLERARAIGALNAITPTDATAIAALCRRLDGIPLALELAAARLRSLSPTQLLERLDEGASEMLRDSHRSERQHSLEAVVAWSIASVSDAQRDVLTAAAICVGGFDFALLTAVVADGDILDDMDTLIALGLIRREPGARAPRFDLLETIRAATRRSLAQGERTRSEARHAVAVTQIIRRAGNQLDRPDSCNASVLSQERGNIRSALEWALDHDGGLALELVARLGHYWFEIGAIDEGLGWIDRASVIPGTDPVLQLHVGATRLHLQGQKGNKGLQASARALRDEAITSNDPVAATRALAQAALAMNELRAPEGEAYLAEAVERAEAVGLDGWTARFGIIGGEAAFLRNDVALGAARLEAAAASADAVGDSFMVGKALGNLAHELEDRAGGSGGRNSRDLELRQALQVARRALERIDADDHPTHRAWVSNIIARAQGRLRASGGGLDELRLAVELTLKFPGGPIVSDTLGSAAIVLACAGGGELALRALAAAERMNEELGFVEASGSPQSADPELEAVRSDLGPARARKAYDSGRTANPQELLSEIAAELSNRAVPSAHRAG